MRGTHGTILTVLLLGVLQQVALANILVVSRGTLEGGTVAPIDNTDVRVLREKLNVTIADFVNEIATPVVHVSAEYELQNDTDRQENLNIAFPFVGVFRPTARGFVDSRDVFGDSEFGCKVTIDGQPVDSAVEALTIPFAPRTPYLWAGWYQVPPEDSQRFLAAWKAWVARDPRLNDLLTEYSHTAVDHWAYHRASEQFNAAAGDLLERNGLEYELRQYLFARAEHQTPPEVYVRELIAEADVTYREPLVVRI